MNLTKKKRKSIPQNYVDTSTIVRVERAKKLMIRFIQNNKMKISNLVNIKVTFTSKYFEVSKSIFHTRFDT